MNKAFKIAWYEAKMSSRGWRFWLLLALVASFSWFARQDFLTQIRAGMFIHSAYSFEHPSFWLMFTVIILGSVALGLDTCGRLRSNGMDKIMFPLPFSSMELIWGRFLGVLYIMLPISAIGVFSLAVWQYYYGHGYVVWQPFIYAYFYLILPCMIPVIATAITLRTFFKNDFAALLCGAVVMIAVMSIGQKAGIILNAPEILKHLQDSSPTIGVRLNGQNYTGAFLVHGLYSLFVLYLAPLYLRRQHIQLWGAKAKSGVVGFSRLLQYISYFRTDSHLEISYRLTLLLLIVICTSGGIWAAYHYQEALEREKQNQSHQRIILTETHIDMPVDVIAYKVEVLPVINNTLPVRSTLHLKTEEELSQLVFELQPKYEVTQVELQGQNVPFERRVDRIYLSAGGVQPAGSEIEVTFQYEWDEPQVTYEYGTLLGKWYPLPARKVQALDGNPFVEREKDLFDAAVTVHLQPGQNSVFAGELIEDNHTAAENKEVWRTQYPVHQMELRWGLYDSVVADRGDYSIRFYHLPHHGYEAQVMLEEVKDQEEYVMERLGDFPFEELVLVETPYNAEEFTFNRGWYQQQTPETRQTRMPGVIRVPEQVLSYIHEGIWLLERMDTDPRKVAYYQMLRPSVLYIRDSFYRSYIQAYFEDAFHPTGELAFWLNEYLYSYAAHLLEQNPWRKRTGLNFDVGTSKDKPVHIAEEKSLVELHKENIYPALKHVRGEGALRMLHHLLEDEKWWAMLTELFIEYRFQEMPADLFIERAEEWYGEPLDWFKEQWIYGSVLPEYQITKAEEKVIEEASVKDEFRIYYEVEVIVKNHGTGKMGVPIFIETETDFIFRNVWLDTGEVNTLVIATPSRPLFTAVDPERWIVQAPYYDEIQKRRVHSELKVFIPGDDRGQGARRRMDSGRRGGRRGGFRF